MEGEKDNNIGQKEREGCAAEYADIILPLAIDSDTYTYGISPEMSADIHIGSRVIVPLGQNKHYSGIVYKIHGNRPDVKNIKYIETIVDDRPVVTREQLHLWEWIADYYMSSLGMVMRAALPSGLKLNGFSHLEALNDGYTPRKIPFISLHPSIDNENRLNTILDSLKRSKVQYRTVIEYIEHIGSIDFSKPQSIPKSSFTSSYSIIKKLIEKNIFLQTESVLPPEEITNIISKLPTLSEVQNKALQGIDKCFENKDTTLLHGVTGSGKTEIYIHLISRELKAGNNVLYMLPEIALTSQLISRLENYFGDRVIAYHSRMTDNSRASVYLRLLESSASNKEGLLIIGVRSSVLLPTPKLSLIIIDEEHDQSFKQSDTSPRYHARDTAIILAGLYNAKILLGSATPSVESYFNAVSGKKYGYVTLTERYGEATLPDIIISDTLRAVKRGERQNHFNRILIEHMDMTLKEDKQIILFQNRRGFSPFVECGSCGWTASCPNCNVTLTYHKSDNVLKCHYCGYTTPMPQKCPTCKAEDLLPKGFGTEKIEEEILSIFPEAHVERLDADTAQSMKNYHRIIRSFEQGTTDILIGTQMVTKGFDFDNVLLVGILNADNMLNYPDFRASERAFQLMLQIAGRAGRRDTKGVVIIQTSQSSHPVLQYILKNDYETFVRSQLSERFSFNYPPYCRIIEISMYHRDPMLLNRAVNHFAVGARKIFGRRLLGPEAPPVDKIKGDYIQKFILKIERDKSVSEAKRLLKELLNEMTSHEDFRYIGIKVDVDPQ